MANNPIIHNDGGIFRFQDYLSQIPEFLRSEEDVVVLMQLFSDYINNAYRNIEIVKKFEFKLVTTESRIGITVKQLNKLNNLFIQCHDRSLPVLYLSEPISNPIASSNYFLGIFDYSGTIENLNPSIINFPKMDGDRVYIKFTDPTQEVNTGVYLYNQSGETLTLDPFGTSQDPFLRTPNEPIQTVGGLSPRIIEFYPSDISDVKVRQSEIVGNIIYYEVFFTAIADKIKNVESIIAKEHDLDNDGIPDFDYLIDYYNAVDTLPSSYRYKYQIDFPINCHNFEWDNAEVQGRGLFYARELTQYGRETTIRVKDENNKFIDPIYNDNTTSINMKSITDVAGLTTVITKYPHGLNVGDTINIELPNALPYTLEDDFNNTSLIIKKIVSSIEFTYDNPVVINTSVEFSDINKGNVIITNLFFDRKIDGDWFPA